MPLSNPCSPQSDSGDPSLALSPSLWVASPYSSLRAFSHVGTREISSLEGGDLLLSPALRLADHVGLSLPGPQLLICITRRLDQLVPRLPSCSRDYLRSLN